MDIERETSKQRGVFITFEGGEGSGKSTQLQLLIPVLEKERIPHTLTREPGGTPAGTRIREILLDDIQLTPVSELLLFNAARHNLCQHIQSHINHGKMVISDRFSDSSLAYQGYARKLGMTLVEQVNQIGTGGLTPDLTILLDIPPVIGLERVKQRGEINRLDQCNLEFHLRVREGYHLIAQQHPKRFRIIDASRSKEEVHQIIRQLVLQTWQERTSPLKERGQERS